jgi:hypothetical protein
MGLNSNDLKRRSSSSSSLPNMSMFKWQIELNIFKPHRQSPRKLRRTQKLREKMKR